MSEIYAPGSIAGPQGPAGPAGSAAAVSALAGAIVPSFVGRNLYDPAKAIDASQVNSADGSLTIGGQPTNLSPMMYCPGATSMISNGEVNAGNWGGGICLYDANGTFMSALASGAGGQSGGSVYSSGQAFTLPGTQTYVRWGHVVPWDSVPDSAMMCYATITGTATLPGSYQPAGLDTVADVNAKDAAVLAAANSMLNASLGSAIQAALNATLPLPPFSNAINLFNPAASIQNTYLRPDGVTTGPTAGIAIGIVYCPGATQFLTNIPLRGSGVYGVCLYDANNAFIEDITTTTLAGHYTSNNGACLTPGTVFTLPGTQTYMKFVYAVGDIANTPVSCLFFAGTAAEPCITSLPMGAGVLGGIVPSQSIKTATQLGCIWQPDANGNPVDNQSLLNAFLATASATNPIKLILDHMIPTTTLNIAAAGYTTIEGLGQGTGLNMMAESTGSITINGGGFGAYNVTPPARTATQIALRNFSVVNAYPLAGAAACAVFLSNCSFVTVENLRFTGTTWSNDFMLTIGNANNVLVRGCSFASAGTSHDGVHVDGLCEDILVSDCYFATGDDAIALNAPEGYGGDISRVAVTNCIFDGSLTVMRIYTSLDPAAMPSNNTHRVRNVVVSNCTGSVTGVCFNLGITNGGLSATTTADQLQDLTVSNCTLASPQGLALLLTPIGSLVFRGIGFIPNGPGGSLINGFFSSVGELMLDDVRIIRNTDGYTALDSFVYVYSGVAMDRVTLVNCRAVDEEGSSYTPHASLIDCNGAIASLRLEAIDMTHIAALWGAGGTTGITSLAGQGVIGTGVAVPDSIMGNNALYLSSTAGSAPSIKIGGAAKRLTLA